MATATKTRPTDVPTKNKSQALALADAAWRRRFHETMALSASLRVGRCTIQTVCDAIDDTARLLARRDELAEAQ